MLYKRSTIMVDNDWGQFIDIDDLSVYKGNTFTRQKIYYKVELYNNHNSLCRESDFVKEIPKMIHFEDDPNPTWFDNIYVCSTIVTTFTACSIMLFAIF